MVTPEIALTASVLLPLPTCWLNLGHMATLGSKEIGQGRLSFSHFKHFSHPFSLYSIHSQVSIQSHVLFSPSVTESRFILLAAKQASESER